MINTEFKSTPISAPNEYYERFGLCDEATHRILMDAGIYILEKPDVSMMANFYYEWWNSCNNQSGLVRVPE